MTVWIDEVGVRRRLPDGGLEEVRWDELERVTLLTTDEDPGVDDVFLVLQGVGGTGCVVPSQDPASDALLARLQQLPGFDNEALKRAMIDTESSRTVVWEKHP